MKAWFVWVGVPYFGWGDYVHGDTAVQAKSMFWRSWGIEVEDWTCLRPHRVSELDDVPLTAENIKEINPKNYDWYPICDCSICNPPPRAGDDDI